MKGSVLRRLAGGVLLLICLTFVFWYIEAGNFTEANVPGTYIVQRDGEASTLILKSDHSFQQELDRAGMVGHAQGSWRLFGEGHIAVSRDFMKFSGQEINQDGTAYGQIKNKFGVLSITVAPNPGGPTFRKSFFR
jgi:hypothetical protein